jgi:hypothetical protein
VTASKQAAINQLVSREGGARSQRGGQDDAAPLQDFHALLNQLPQLGGRNVLFTAQQLRASFTIVLASVTRCTSMQRAPRKAKHRKAGACVQ